MHTGRRPYQEDQNGEDAVDDGVLTAEFSSGAAIGSSVAWEACEAKVRTGSVESKEETEGTRAIIFAYSM